MLTQPKMECITLFPGKKRGENKTVVKLLEKLRKRKGVVFKIVNESLILKDVIALPFIKTDVGEVYFEIRSIKRFLKNQIKGSVQCASFT